MSCSAPLGRWLPTALLSSLAVSLALLGPSPAQTPTGKKYALLVGVRAYKHRDLEDLKYTENDVEELAKALLGFAEVVVLTSTRGEKNADAAPTAASIRKQLKALLDKVSKHDTIVVALAGHGVQLKVKGMETEEGFFCPADARPRQGASLAELSKTMLGFTELFKELQDSGVGVKLLLVDACRNDPAAGRSVNADAMPRAPKGMAALFSCRSGERAFETDKLGKGHGVFFHYVLQGLRGEAKNRRGDVTWDALAEYVKDKVSDEVPALIRRGAKQTPEEIKKLEGKAPILIGADKRPVVKEIVNSIGMKLVRIPAGTFLMGSTKAEQDAAIAELLKRNLKPWTAHCRFEGPRHRVEITKPFYMGVYLVTQAEYKKVMGTNPSWFSAESGSDKVKGLDTSRFPVENVTWNAAVKFCEKLSSMAQEKAAKRAYRLPTEAEWEYACRAGTTTTYHFGDTISSKQANYGENLGCTTRVGSYAPNAWGLYDMHGNVYQWCWDRYGKDYYKNSLRRDPTGPASGPSRVHRGGSWLFDAMICRAAHRNAHGPDEHSSDCGFRVVCVLAGTR
jgi:formylglycine-generating enzyme required for sulfatase activity